MPDENNAQELLDNDSTAEQNKSSIAELLDMSTASIMELLYNNINALFGAGNQLFVMEFPTRSLSLKSYEYTINDCYSTLTKPYPVAENEFMLSEQMFDISPIVQGSNGEKLSTVYSTVLNNFVPKLETLDAFIKDQASLRKWLTEDVTDEVDGVEQTMSRMAMAKLLYGQYLDKRNEWYSEKEEKYDIYKSQDKLDEYTKWLSSEGLVHEEQLNNFYNDAIVRGHYHEVLTLLGFLNVSSPSEVLESTKQKMRSSLRRSMDGSSDVYPVQFMPADWFKSLKPNLQPKDLTVATDRLLVEYNNKRDRLRTLKRELAELSLNELSPAEKERIERELEQAESAVSQSEMNMVNQYGEGAVSVVKSVIKIYEQYANPATAAETAIAEARTAVDNNTATKDQTRLVSMIGDIAGNVVSGITNLYAAQQENIAKITHLSEARLAFASSKVRDMRAQRLRLEEQIESVQADIDYLAPLVTSTISASMQGEKPGEALLPAENESDGEDNFTEIIISKEKESQATSNQQTSSTQSSSWGVSFLIGSAGGSKSTSEGTNTNGESKLKNSMQIGLRVKKVSIERGGWFNPNVFKMSNSYYRLADTQFSKGLTKEEIQAVYNMPSSNESEKLAKSKAIRGLVTYNSENSSNVLEYVMPGYPMGFVIAKDITIRIEASEEESKHASSYLETKSSTSGGILGFRANTSGASTDQSEAAYFGSSDNYFYIRIPGPQILGWFIELTPGDNATPYEKLHSDIYSKKDEQEEVEN